ncbi:ribosomal protein L7Ae-like RNA K-turn-binding protein [Paenibacillus cellulosilyticus]|uniref:Ribosomal protein L7Ae-like RNA K-turn-binding protein n=1 Tax=Paenibacillus cellulosilyticus TaxID=375489 RepID=A0A2V2Z1F2_9BACL|nr:ribosomal L7Ae/L30e/S12e/Gadd45 family protein [Paenibacillus cellulosilyticus]PWW06439.1 ribosomal protein L7Ae-like RNA K-turn-binding protein [Paenibacillus cellulosilyticus]QKS46215.1 ribosomal L7Ae/L30e/S12e/Gadd45 family protein [Paenibacillus cellulosilyticus]
MSKALSHLGMAMRAGKLVTGDDTVLKSIRQGKAHLVIVAGDASDNTKKKYRDKCGYYNVKLAEAFDRVELGKAIGKEARVLVAVTDAGFARMIVGQLSSHSEVDHIDKTTGQQR